MPLKVNTACVKTYSISITQQLNIHTRQFPYDAKH